MAPLVLRAPGLAAPKVCWLLDVFWQGARVATMSLTAIGLPMELGSRQLEGLVIY